MSDILGYIQGEMRRETVEPLDTDVAFINSLTNPPPVPVTKQDIYIRRCRLASDAVDASYGRFRTTDLSLLLDLVNGVSMLIGHNKKTAGIARFFGGSIEILDNIWNPVTLRQERISYIVPKFYWMRKHSQGEDLRINIDGGIYHQVSISWWYRRATCSICGKDMRECGHIPGRVYNNSLAFYYYDMIGEVLEGSIVFAGAQPYTGFYLNSERKNGLKESMKIFRKKENSVPIFSVTKDISQKRTWHFRRVRINGQVKWHLSLQS